MTSPEIKIAEVILKERTLLKLVPGELHPTGIGLALSGGGIRSASFALGVVQQLVVALNRGLETFHYLSTVSGGGYMGTAIGWLRYQYKEKFQDHLGSKHWGDRSTELRGLVETRSDRAPKEQPKTWLDYARMHGNYLLPRKISVLALVGVALRNLVFTVVVYGGAAVAVLAFLSDFNVLPSWCGVGCSERRPWFGVERWLMLSLGLLGVHIFLYGLGSWLTSVPVLLGALALALTVAGGAFAVYQLVPFLLRDVAGRWPYVASVAVAALACLCVALLVLYGSIAGSTPLAKFIRSWSYQLRTWAQQRLGGMLGICLGLLILSTVPAIYHSLRRAATWAPAAVGGGSSLLTGFATILKFVIGKKKNPNPGFFDRALGAVAPIVGAAAVIYGGLILAYGVQACAWMSQQMSPGAAGLLLAAVLMLGFFCNANYLSLGRMYRDRLMEMFMPSKPAIDEVQWKPATEAEGFLISDLRPDLERCPNLFHLVCCNVVLRDAQRDSFRGRAGDSFTFSPLYSGSTATGWMPSELVGGGGMSLATAMATSGAAANPDAAVAGAGLTRNRLVAFLMCIFNVRLGYWLRNPKHMPHGRSQKLRWPPNFWIPGVWQGLLGRGLEEEARYIELSDGGHFDNTALYELIRRRVRIIVLSEAGADPDYVMDDLANAIERVRADLGVHIRFDIKGFEPAEIRPHFTGPCGPNATPERYAERGYALATIRYPKQHLESTEDSAPNPTEGTADWKGFDTGFLLYLQATRIEETARRTDIDSFARVHPDFPNESTADQFFDEDQLEAYRELGMEITQQAFREIFSPAKHNAMTKYLAQELGVRRKAST